MPATDHHAGIAATLEQWRGGDLPGELEVDVTMLPAPARYGEPPTWLPPAVVRALASQGIARPYEHQVAAWEALAGGRNVVVATPTASGKTLCYNVPALTRLATDPAARALYVFPTKALARDQEASIRALIGAAGIAAEACVYDGDTPPDERRSARQGARVLITNPDMLHTGILPHHASWARFFAGLELVVVDELHQYRGVFGSHVANVMRRLDRVARFHGARPGYAACSATIANPVRLAADVLGGRFELIERSGAPVGTRTFLVYNPELVNPAAGLRRSALKVAARLAGDLVQHQVVTLVFCQTRRGVEITLRYLRERLVRAGRSPERIRGYRGGYLPLLRREIEGALREGKLDAVVATNALELGIDVGELDAVVLAGYPGTIAALRQRAGRAGRRQGPSLAVLVARGNPLDQFLTREPAYLLESSPEQALVHPDNVEILLAHLRCAAFELPLAAGEGFGSLVPADADAALDYLAEEGVLAHSGERYHFVAGDYPAAAVGLRDAGGERFVVVERGTNEPLAEVDPRAARHELHEEAVYQHEGQTYRVERLDLEQRRAHVSAVEPVYYTVATVAVELELVAPREQRRLAGGQLGCGDLEVTERITGYKQVRFGTHENLGYGPVELPPLTLETEGIWIAADEPIDPGALEGLGHALHQCAALRLMCDPRDLARTVRPAPGEPAEDGRRFRPALFLYDVHAGGVGLIDLAYAEAEPMLEDAARLIEGCRCAGGCPSCVGPAPEGSEPVKELAHRAAATLLGRDRGGR